MDTTSDTSRFNPLIEEPHPTVIRAVSRLGFAGLMLAATGSALLRLVQALIGRLRRR